MSGARGGNARVVKVSAGLHLTISSSIIIFGIGVPPIWQGLVGIIAALEGYFGVVQGDRFRVNVFFAGLLVNTIIALALGFFATVETSHAECNEKIEGLAVRKEQNFTISFTGFVADCTLSYLMYAYVQFGSAVTSMALFIVCTIFGCSRSKHSATSPVNDNSVFLLS